MVQNYSHRVAICPGSPDMSCFRASVRAYGRFFLENRRLTRDNDDDGDDDDDDDDDDQSINQVYYFSSTLQARFHN